MRTTHVCPKCRFNRILVVQVLPDDRGEYGTAPMHAALIYKGQGFWGNDKTAAVGQLSSCICKRCGFTELYTLGFEQIPIDGQYVHELVGPEPEGPFR